MNARRFFIRKIVYFSVIAVLLLPLSLLSMPASRNAEGEQVTGGVLAKMRKKHKLSQAELGEIDPTSEAMRLSSLGMSGFAATMLWGQAIHYKKVEDWTKFSAALEQIAKLQPNFVQVWEYQSWNVSYNISVEFDDYRDRYVWVMRGLRFLEEGLKYNEDNPKLQWKTGWICSNKIGNSDEKRQFRKLFKEDLDYHPPERPAEMRDNFLVAKKWFQDTCDSVDTKGKSLGEKSEVLYQQDPARSQINYAEALEEEGTHGELARNAWKNAEQDWTRYAEYPMYSRFYKTQFRIGDLEAKEKEANRLLAELDVLLPNLREQIHREKLASLSKDVRQALDKNPNNRTLEEAKLASDAQNVLDTDANEIALRAKQSHPESAGEARRIARQYKVTLDQIAAIKNARQLANFRYWQLRTQFEQLDEALLARESIYQGSQALANADLDKAKQLYEKGFAYWKIIFDKYPEIMEEGTAGGDIVDVVEKYHRILEERDEELPVDFILLDVIKKHDRHGKLARVLQDLERRQKSKQPEDSAADKDASQEKTNDSPVEPEEENSARDPEENSAKDSQPTSGRK